MANCCHAVASASLNRGTLAFRLTPVVDETAHHITLAREELVRSTLDTATDEGCGRLRRGRMKFLGRSPFR